jgi:hypothetical protein
MRRILASALTCAVMGLACVAHGATMLAEWTFETSIPTTAGPHTAEGGVFAGTSQALGGTGGTWSNPAGNGTAESFSSNGWDVGDYFQFMTSSTGYESLNLSFSATSSNTGPRDFKVQGSTDGVSFSDIGFAYAVLANATPNPVWNATTASAIYEVSTPLPASLENQASLWVRLVQNSTVSANGGTVAATGTSRVDTVRITGLVPEPSTLVIASIAGIAAFGLRRRSGR